MERHIQTILVGAGTLMGTAMLGLLGWLALNSHENSVVLAAHGATLNAQSEQMAGLRGELSAFRIELANLVNNLKYAQDVRTDVDIMTKALEDLSKRLVNLERKR